MNSVKPFVSQRRIPNSAFELKQYPDTDSTSDNGKIVQIIDNLDHGLNTTEINPDLFLPTPRQYIFYHHSNADYLLLSVKLP